MSPLGFGNPSTTHTDGACNLYNGQVTYVLTWTSILGTTGAHEVYCAWVLGRKTCTPGELNGSPGDFVST